MGRHRLIASLAGVTAFLALLLPASALAGTYSWNMPGDPGIFMGSNPEQKYGAPSWGYQASGPLTFSSGTWKDSFGDSISASGGRVVLQAAEGHSATITWTNPTTQTASVASNVTPSATCLTELTSVPSSVAPGATMTLTLSGGLTAACSASGTISITVTTPPPTVTLTSPASGATISDSAPTFSGSASSGFGISDEVSVRVYSGSSASGTPVETLSTTASNGSYSVGANPDLAGGKYTAVAEEDDLGGGRGLSSPVTFQIKLPPPALTLDEPAAGSSVSRASLVFGGRAGDAAGDSPTITIYLYRGKHASGHPIGELQVQAVGSSWSARWPHALRPGFYTAQAVQTDNVGQTTRTSPCTFLLVPSATVVGGKLTLSRAGTVSVPVGCTAPAGQTCTGTILVVTRSWFQTESGGPTGPLELMFVHVFIDAGATDTIHAIAPALVVNALKHTHQVAVTVMVDLSKSGGGAIDKSFSRILTIK